MKQPSFTTSGIWCMLCVILSALVPAQAQTIIRGTVIDRDAQNGLAGVNITIQEPGNVAIVGYALTDPQGAFRLEYKGQKDSIIVSASGFNLSKQTKTIANRSQEVHFVTFSEAISINEVRVVARNIRQVGDTVKYSVGAYVEQNDRTIGDILRKLPGIEVKDNGVIHYNNRPINNYYIEGLDLLKGRYGLANNTIQARDVAEVQVLENHQPIKALEGVEFSEDAAINLKLKDGAKGALMAYALLGAGVGKDPDLLLAADLSSMYFNRNMQNITTYKGNNTGNDVSREQAFMLGGAGAQGSGSQNWLNVQSPSSPAISQNRYLNNQVHALSFNNVWRLKNNYQLNANLNYTNDRQDKNSYSLTEHLLPGDNLLAIEEWLSSRLYKNQGSADVILNANTKQFYLDNTLSLKGVWDSEQGNALTAANNIYQNLSKPNYSLGNAFRLIKNYAKTSLTFSSNNNYSSTPHNLRVEPMLYDFLFDPDASLSKGLKQELLLHNFSSANNVAFGFDHGKWKQNYSVGFNANLQNLTTELFPETNSGILLPAPDSLKNDLSWNRFDWLIRPSYSYMYNRLRATLNVPVQYVMLQANDYLPAAKSNTNHIFFNPSLSVMYKLSPYWDASANAGYQNSLGGLNNAYTGYIMNSYRNLQRNEGKLHKLQTQNYNVNLSYRNPIYSLFGNIGASYVNRRANLLFGYNYLDILRVQTSYDLPNTTEGINLSGSLSKGLDIISSTLTAGGNYSTTNGSQMNQGSLMRFDNQRYSLHVSINTKIQRWANISYRLEHAQSRNKVENNNSRFAPISTYLQRAQLNLFPIKDLTLNLSWEYFYNSAIASGSRNMSFGDVNIRYKLPKAEIIFDYTNLFNTKEYISASYSNTSTYYYSYMLRPAELMLKVRFKLK
ncbi:MAG: carboxypeptidase-like regulatory domain-containing protein [Bacteroidales bacterium]|nr:carboxypeptidase-like regulatory domain-containing protein [Bacteroidales bacterium]